MENCFLINIIFHTVLYKKKVITKIITKEREKCKRNCSSCTYKRNYCYEILVMIYRDGRGWSLINLGSLCEGYNENYYYVDKN